MNDRKPILSVPVRNALFVAAVLVAGDAALRAVHAAPDATPPKVLTAQEFKLVDKEGNARATMALQPDGSPYISLSDKDGKRRITLRLRPDGGSVVSLNDPDGAERVAMDTQPDGSATLSVSNKQKKGGAAFLVPPDGNPVAVIKDKDGKVVFAQPEPQIEVGPDGKEKAPGEKAPGDKAPAPK